MEGEVIYSRVSSEGNSTPSLSLDFDCRTCHPRAFKKRNDERILVRNLSSINLDDVGPDRYETSGSYS